MRAGDSERRVAALIHQNAPNGSGFRRCPGCSGAGQDRQSQLRFSKHMQHFGLGSRSGGAPRIRSGWGAEPCFSVHDRLSSRAPQSRSGQS